MYTLFVGVCSGFHDGLRHGRVREYGADDVLAGHLVFASHHGAGNHFRHVVTDEVAAEPFAGVLVEDDLHEAVATAGSSGFARCGKREFANEHFTALFHAGAFGEAHGSDFGSRVGTAGDVAVIDGLGIETGDFLDADFCFMGSDVSQGRTMHDVAYSIDDPRVVNAVNHPQ